MLNMYSSGQGETFFAVIGSYSAKCILEPFHVCLLLHETYIGLTIRMYKQLAWLADDNSPESLMRDSSSGFREDYHRITKQTVRAYMERLHLPLTTTAPYRLLVTRHWNLDLIRGRGHHAPSFSHGFFLFGLLASVPCPSSTVGGISLIPGTGFPLVISSTMWAKEVG